MKLICHEDGRGSDDVAMGGKRAMRMRNDIEEEGRGGMRKRKRKGGRMKMREK
jgi:hypothetical protein